MLPCWQDSIVPDLWRHGCVLIVSHGNTLRALVKYLEGVSDEEAPRLEVPNATPVCYQFQSGRVTRLADLTRRCARRSLDLGKDDMPA